MTATAGRDEQQRARDVARHRASRTPLWIAAAAVAGFLLAFAWQFPRARRAEATAAYATRALEAARLEASLAGAVIAAQRGEYELGRQRASAFFTGLQRHVVPGATGDAATVARQLVGQRDATITALARSDPASASVLSQTLTRYRELIRQAGLDSAVTAAGPR